ncbi:MAG: hypothetical protein HY332_22490 [Chloroflexi bacterium]|nr:hypothetical protein [Chloroflexota bacterium]
MARVVLTTLRPGLQKIPLTNAIRTHAGLSLSEAKACTDRYLAGERVEIEVPDEAAAEALAREAVRVGAVAKVERAAALYRG